MGLLSGDELRDTLDRAHKRAWEKRIIQEWEKLSDRFKTLSERENSYSEEELADDN